uniref:Non-structural maintenance of chromosomes element 1 homolog n=1 Tax=Davidia involucrata TaxID=16924 RepID=A0A5B7AG44_DAVIN
MPVLCWRHHTLIQALLSRGPLKEEEFHSIFSAVTGKNPGTHQQLFNDYLLKINKELSYVQFELRACRNQYDGNVYYGVVNNVADEQSKLGTRYTVPQIAFYKGVIEAIVQDATAQGTISNFDALNTRLENQVWTGTGSQSQGGPSEVPPAFKNFSLSQKEKTLEELVQDRWLCSTPDGNIRLGVRSFLDLRSWFHSNDIPACEVCNEAGVKAELCQNEGCTVRIHQYCLKKKFSQRRIERVCPGCGTSWLPPVSKAEAIEEEDDPNGPSQSQPHPQPSTRKRLRTGKTVDADTVGSGSSQPSMPNSDTMRTTRRSARLR